MSGSESHIRTERLLLRPWELQEAERLFDIRRRPEIAQWLGDPTPWTSADSAVDNISAWSALTESDDPLGVWAMVPTSQSGSTTGPPAGSLSLKHLPDGVELHIGWTLHPDSTGKGYAAEAARAVLAHSFDRGVERVWAVMWSSNLRSARVAALAGMKDLGVRDDPWFGTPDAPTSRMFRATAEDFSADSPKG